MAGKILVTGADGFIGSHLVEALIKEGFDVRAMVLYNSFNSWGWLDEICEGYKEKLEVVAGDIRDPFGIRKIMQGCDVVMNLAAIISIPFSYRSPVAGNFRKMPNRVLPSSIRQRLKCLVFFRVVFSVSI